MIPMECHKVWFGFCILSVLINGFLLCCLCFCQSVDRFFDLPGALGVIFNRRRNWFFPVLFTARFWRIKRNDAVRRRFFLNNIKNMNNLQLENVEINKWLCKFHQTFSDSLKLLSSWRFCNCCLHLVLWISDNIKNMKHFCEMQQLRQTTAEVKAIKKCIFSWYFIHEGLLVLRKTL